MKKPSMFFATPVNDCTLIGYVYPRGGSLNEDGTWKVKILDGGYKAIHYALQIQETNKTFYFPIVMLDNIAKYFYENVKKGDLIALKGKLTHRRVIIGTKIKDKFEILGLHMIKLRKEDKMLTKEIPWDNNELDA
jgi:hypothetical protein